MLVEEVVDEEIEDENYGNRNNFIDKIRNEEEQEEMEENGEIKYYDNERVSEWNVFGLDQYFVILLFS